MPTPLDAVRQQYPALRDLSDEDAIDVIHRNFYPDLPLETVQKAAGYTPPPPPPPVATVGDRVKDIGVSLARGGVQAVEAPVGILDMATGGRAGKFLDEHGVDLKGADQYWAEKYSPRQQYENQQVADAYKGAPGDDQSFLARVGRGSLASLQNPSTIVQALAQMLPTVAGAGIGARALLSAAPALGTLAPALTGGAALAGQTAEQIRTAPENPSGLLTGGQSALAAGAGVATVGLGAFAGKLAQELGFTTAPNLIAGIEASPQAAGAKALLVKRVLGGAVTEGFLQQLPQGVQQQVAINLANDQPIDKDVDQAAVLSTLQGVAMGGASNVLPRPRALAGAPVPKPPPDHAQAVSDILGAQSADDAIAAFARATKPPTTFPNGVEVSERYGGATREERVKDLQDNLADKGTRDQIRATSGDDALGTILYYANLVNNPNVPQRTRDNFLDLAERLAFQAQTKEVPEVGKNAEPPAIEGPGEPPPPPPPPGAPPALGGPPRALEGPEGTPALGAPPTRPALEGPEPQERLSGPRGAPPALPSSGTPVLGGGIRVDSEGNAKRETIADWHDTAERLGREADQASGMTGSYPKGEHVIEMGGPKGTNDLGGQVRALSLQAQRDAGWNHDWPFVPADLGNADFREHIQNDLGLSPEEKAAIFSAGHKLGVVPKSEIDQAAHAAATSPQNARPEPTKAQKEAGNYAMGHLKIGGLDISVENPESSVRSNLHAEDLDPLIDKAKFIQASAAEKKKALKKGQQLPSSEDFNANELHFLLGAQQSIKQGQPDKALSELQLMVGKHPTGRGDWAGRMRDDIERLVEGKWATPMPDHYGYIRRTVGADGEKVDAFVRRGTPENYVGDVYVIDQHVDGKFDEHKAMIGYGSEAEAKAAYKAAYSKDWEGGQFVTRMSWAAFHQWLKSPERTKQPFGDEKVAPKAPQFSDKPDFVHTFPDPRAHMAEMEKAGRPSGFDEAAGDAELLDQVREFHVEVHHYLHSDMNTIDYVHEALTTGKDPDTGKPIKDKDRVRMLGDAEQALESIKDTLSSYGDEMGHANAARLEQLHVPTETLEAKVDQAAEANVLHKVAADRAAKGEQAPAKKRSVEEIDADLTALSNEATTAAKQRVRLDVGDTKENSPEGKRLFDKYAAQESSKRQKRHFELIDERSAAMSEKAAKARPEPEPKAEPELRHDVELRKRVSILKALRECMG